MEDGGASQAEMGLDLLHQHAGIDVGPGIVAGNPQAGPGSGVADMGDVGMTSTSYLLSASS